jgi:hypothetical protein
MEAEEIRNTRKIGTPFKYYLHMMRRKIQDGSQNAWDFGLMTVLFIGEWSTRASRGSVHRQSPP